MPAGSKVHRCYKRLMTQHIKRGTKSMSPAKAAKICQASTGQALATGRRPKGKGRKHHSSHSSGHGY